MIVFFQTSLGPALSARKVRFNQFASIEYQQESYMTPRDFLFSVMLEKMDRKCPNTPRAQPWLGSLVLMLSVPPLRHCREAAEKSYIQKGIYTTSCPSPADESCSGFPPVHGSPL